MRTLHTRERLAEVVALFLQKSLEILGGQELGIDGRNGQSVLLEAANVRTRIKVMQLTKVTVDVCELTAFCEQYGVAKLSLFGSVLRDDFDSSRSDIDVLIEFRPDATKSLFTLVTMERTLSRLFGRPVDLNTPGSLSKYFREQVMESAEVLYDAA